MAGGASNPAEVSRRCGAGTGCGGCLPALRTLLAEMGLCTEGERAVVGDHAA